MALVFPVAMSLIFAGMLLIPALPIRSTRKVTSVATSYSNSKSTLIPIIPGRARP